MRKFTMLFLGTTLALGFTVARAADEKISLDQLPAKVVAAAMAKFPGAKRLSAEKEVEKGITSYELLIDNHGSKIDLSIEEDGTIVGVERQIKKNELPKAVQDRLNAKYPGAQLKKIEEVTEGDAKSFEIVVVQTTVVSLDLHGKIITEEHERPSQNN